MTVSGSENFPGEVDTLRPDNARLPRLLQMSEEQSPAAAADQATLTGAPHGYIEQNGGGEERPAILAWMRYWIYNDSGAKHYFYGDDCVMCMAPWENPQRKNWPDM